MLIIVDICLFVLVISCLFCCFGLLCVGWLIVRFAFGLNCWCLFDYLGWGWVYGLEFVVWFTCWFGILVVCAVVGYYGWFVVAY